MKYRCYQCQTRSGERGLDFESDDESPACPMCGGTGLQEAGGCLEPVVLVHYQLPIEHPNPRVRLTKSQNAIACRPDMAVLGTGVRATAEPLAVTCPDCRESEAFKAGRKGRAFRPAYDRPAKLPAVEGIERQPDGTLPGQFRADRQDRPPAVEGEHRG